MTGRGLGALFGEGGDVLPNWSTALRELLAASARDGVDFDTAWDAAVVQLRLNRDSVAFGVAGEESCLAFARPRFELAYYGLDPSLPTHEWTTSNERFDPEEQHAA